MKRSTGKVTRRRLLQAGAGMALGGALADTASAAADTPRPSVYEAIGIKHVINATGTVTNLGGSVMPAEVVAAWADASRHFVNLLDLQDKVGDRIAKLIGVEAAMVTTGAAGALLLGTTAVVTRGEPRHIRRLPDAKGMKNEVIVQKSHHTCYDNQLTDVGVRLVEVESPADVKRAVNERTALMFFMNVAEADGRISLREWLKLAREHKVPTLLDAAADVPPLERLSGYNRMGFDLVAFSGGKALRGPQATGLLCGRRDLVAAAALQMLDMDDHDELWQPPSDWIDRSKFVGMPRHGIGRGFKVSKEQIVALLKALELFVAGDYDRELADARRRLDAIADSLASTACACRRIEDEPECLPVLEIALDEPALGRTAFEICRALRAGSPPCYVGHAGLREGKLIVNPLHLDDEQSHQLARRLREELASRG
jgi:D-glucosaminate-6-phosphate ammonia-lyase